MGSKPLSRLERAGIAGACGCVLVVGGAGVAVLVFLYLRFAPPSRPTLEALEAEGHDIVRQVEAYKARHGTYPADLPSAGIDPPTHLYGRWRYKSNGASYSLWIPMDN